MSNRLALLVSSVVCLSGSSLAGEIPDLDTVRTAVRYYQSSVVGLEGEYTSKLLPNPKREFVADTVHLEDLQREIQFAFDRGNQRLFLDVTKSWVFSRISDSQQFESRTLEAFDGDSSYFLLHTKTASAIPTEVPLGRPFILNMVRKNGLTMHGPWDLAGMRTQFQGLGLVDLLSRSDVRFLGVESIDASECYHLSTIFGAHHYDVWLDPNHDFLPRRQMYRKRLMAISILGDQDPRAQREFVTLTTTAFAQFDDPLHGGKRWLPVQGVVESMVAISEIRVSNMKLIDAMPIERFRIDPADLPAGVQVNDLAGERWYTADAAVTWRQIKSQIDKESDEIDRMLGRTKAASTSSARLIESNGDSRFVYHRQLLALASLVVLLAGIVAILRVRGLKRPED